MALRCFITGLFAVGLMLAEPSGSFLTFTVTPQSSEVTINSSVVLRCEVAEGVIEGWLFNGTSDLPAGAVVNNGTLTFESFQPANAGFYRCVASNHTAFRQVSHQARLSYFAQRTYTVQPANFTAYVLGGSTVRAPAGFDCMLASYQPNGVRPYIVWEVLQSNGTSELYDPRQPTVTGARSVALQLDHHGYLQIFDPQPADDMTHVRCVASNPVSPSEVVMSKWASITISDQSRPASLPIFSTQPAPTVYPVPNQDMVLPCSKTTSNSSISIVWRESNSTWSSNFFFWGFPFPIPSDFSIVGYANLHLHNPQAHIGNTFACVAYSSGVSQSTAIASTVVVASPPPYTPPIYNDYLYSYAVPAGRVLTLPLGVPTRTSASWWQNGQLVPLGPKYSISPGDQSLVIQNVQPGDSGIYQGAVQATSQGGQDMDILVTFEVTVHHMLPAVLNISCDHYVNGTHLVVFCSFNVSTTTVQCSINQGTSYICSFPIYLDVAAYLTVTATDVFGTIATVTLVSQAAPMLACGGTVSANSDVILISCQASFTPNMYSISENGATLGTGLPPYTLSVLTLDPGVHTFVIIAANGVTGTSAASRVSITVPAYVQCFPSPTDVNTTACASNIPLLGAQCSLDQGPAVPCSFPLNTSTLPPGTHNIRVTSNKGNITLTSSATFILQGLPPFAPKIDFVQVDEGNAIFIHWTVNSTLLRPVSSYELQVTGPSAHNQTTPLTSTSYTLKVGVAQGQTYVFQVRALNVYGTGNYSDPRALVVPGHQMPWWVYLIIALLLLLTLLLCCVLCCCLLCCCCKEGKTYDPRKYEEEYRKDMESENEAVEMK